MISGLIALVIYIIVIGLIAWLLTLLIDAVPLPDPFNRVARVLIMVIDMPVPRLR